MDGGVKAGVKLKVAPVRFAPVTVKFEMVLTAELLTAKGGLTARTDGLETTVKLPVEVAVTPLTVTETGPVVAVVGTVTVRDVAVAATTVAATPLKLTVLEDALILKFWPWMVTVDPMAPV
jgi:hypothetical protein